MTYTFWTSRLPDKGLRPTKNFNLIELGAVRLKYTTELTLFLQRFMKRNSDYLVVDLDNK